jgi:tRNA-splicing ligase RtcB
VKKVNKMDKKIKIFSDNIDGKTLNQFYESMNHEWTVQGALMPDAHLGYDMPIGGVISTRDVIVPSWVGYDIGCGMCALKISAKKEDIYKFSNEIFNKIYEVIPVGFKHRTEPINWNVPINSTKWFKEMFNENNGLCQLGTLGGGNHFIEIGYDENDEIWIIVHSGSRNVGHKTASHYMKIEKLNQNKKGWKKALEVNSENGINYIRDMEACLQFALENRLIMINKVNILINDIIYQSFKSEINYTSLINRNHNHAEKKGDVWIHRKGATHADAGMLGVIPGNMKDGSFIVRGLGNPDSLYSSSHGAGRIYSRRQAKEQLNLDDFAKEMKGITAKITKSTLDESKGAYKNVFKVMDDQKDLVKIVHYVKPIINVKG